MKLLISIIVITCLFFSCATYTPPQQHNIVKSKTYDMPFDKIWESIINYMSSKSLSLKNIDKASGIIVTEYLHFSNTDDCMDCGDVSNRDITGTDRRGDLNVFVQKINDNQTKVTINTRFSCYLNYMGWDEGANGRRDCTSTGVWENEIFEYITP